VSAIRSALPLVQRLLPLLEGNFANVLGALMAPQPGSHPSPQQVKVDMEPVERGLAEVRTSHRELKTQIQEQGTSLKRVEDQLERVREATDRNTLEQQELVEDLRAVGSRISTLAIVGVVLLLVSLGLNIYFLIQLQHILR
jgi:septal ring factor EnvC (AmiA/AmiB activator)